MALQTAGLNPPGSLHQTYSSPVQWHRLLEHLNNTHLPAILLGLHSLQEVLADDVCCIWRLLLAVLLLHHPLQFILVPVLHILQCRVLKKLMSQHQHQGSSPTKLSRRDTHNSVQQLRTAGRDRQEHRAHLSFFWLLIAYIALVREQIYLGRLQQGKKACSSSVIGIATAGWLQSWLFVANCRQY